MQQRMIEQLESRRLLSAATLVQFAPTPVPHAQSLTTAQVKTILAQAISQSMNRAGQSTEVAVVVDREGTVLGMLASQGAISAGIAPQVIADATVRARTAAFFESSGEAFTTRTARFIIQNHFPPGILNAAGGPLYGVQFSDLPGSDILSPSLTPAVSGDPGGIPLYFHGVPVGGIGTAGDFRDLAATSDLVNATQDNHAVASLDNHLYNANPKGHVYNGAEELDRDESLAEAGARGFMAPAAIRATNIFVGGLRLPFVAEGAAHGRPNLSFQHLIGSGAATEFTVAGGTFAPVAAGTTHIIAGTPEMMNATIGGVNGLLRDRANVQMSATPGVPLTSGGALIPHTNPQDSDANPIIGATPDPGGSPTLTAQDVTTIIAQAVDQATITRAGIRKPNGVNAEVHVVVVDTAGDVLGAFRMNDGTNFSYDVAVQKARTAAYFSDDTHAFSTRAIGFLAQKFFPPGITPAQQGPLYHLQNDVVLPGTTTYNGLANGITIFPGGVPLYIGGHLVGAVGVSGDGVDQDDLISFSGAHGFEAPAPIRSDSLSAANAASFLNSKVAAMSTSGFDLEKERRLLQEALAHVRLPYVKFPRNPLVNH